MQDPQDPAITHWLVGDEDVSGLTLPEPLSGSIDVVSVQWLQECLSAGACLPLEGYIVEQPTGLCSL